MSDKNKTTEVDVVEKKPGFVSRFRTNHPRVAKALLITAGALVIGGGAYAAGAKKSSDSVDVDIDGTFEPATDTSSEA